MNKASNIALGELERVFKDTVVLVDKALNGRAFRPVRSLNAAVFDSAMVGIATRLSRSPAPTAVAIATTYDALVAQTGLQKVLERGYR